MAMFAHITPPDGASRVRFTAAPADELLNAYSSWLFFERHFLLIGRFGVQEALGRMNTVETNNPGAAFHLPGGSDLPDYSEPARRAALMLATAGVDLAEVSLGIQRKSQCSPMPSHR